MSTRRYLTIIIICLLLSASKFSQEESQLKIRREMCIKENGLNTEVINRMV